MADGPDGFPSAPDYGRSLRGFGVNLVVPAIRPSVAFQTSVLGAEIVTVQEGFAVLRWRGAEWMLHADATYHAHALAGELAAGTPRGGAVELRLHDGDPDASEDAARVLGHEVIAPAADKPHGLREVYLRDPAGFIWVVDRPIADG
jgi:catechol 2,3-dioxygenase-like lactoylglutathione lyase family enzyme